MKDRYKIGMTVNGHSGDAEITWIPDNKYNVAHYATLITVSFKDCRWEHLHICDKNKLEDAIENAKEYLKLELQRCTLV